ERVTGYIDQRPHRSGLPAHGLASGEAEHASNDGVRLADLLSDLIEVTQEPWTIVHIAPREKERRFRDGERVAQLVRNARTHGTSRGEARRAPLLLQGIEVAHGPRA